MTLALVLALAPIVALCVIACTLIGAHFERTYTAALVGLLLGPVGILWTLCAAASRYIDPRPSKTNENVCFALGPIGLVVTWWGAPPGR